MGCQRTLESAGTTTSPPRSTLPKTEPWPENSRSFSALISRTKLSVAVIFTLFATVLTVCGLLRFFRFFCRRVLPLAARSLHPIFFPAVIRAFRPSVHASRLQTTVRERAGRRAASPNHSASLVERWLIASSQGGRPSLLGILFQIELQMFGSAQAQVSRQILKVCLSTSLHVISVELCGTAYMEQPQ
jgi:hypothetical protein